MSFPFGGGIGRMREVCGAFSGIALVAGQKFPVTSPADTQNKKDSFALIQNCAAIFKDKFGSIVCHELLELRKGEQPQLQENGHPVPKKISCATLVEEAARIIGEKL